MFFDWCCLSFFVILLVHNKHRLRQASCGYRLYFGPIHVPNRSGPFGRSCLSFDTHACGNSVRLWSQRQRGQGEFFLLLPHDRRFSQRRAARAQEHARVQNNPTSSLDPVGTADVAKVVGVILCLCGFPLVEFVHEEAGKIALSSCLRYYAVELPYHGMVSPSSIFSVGFCCFVDGVEQ